MPWLAPYRAAGAGVARDILAGAPVHRALNAALQTRPAAMCGGLRLRFVAHGDLPDGEAYEAFIARSGCVPTRDNAHDLFNGLVWLRFGALKQRLNALQAAQIAEHGIGRTRGPQRDALTLFDENAALLQAPAVLTEALRMRDWVALFVEHRAVWRQARLTLFGHALLEKLLQPRKAITAHVWLLPPPEESGRGEPDVGEPDSDAFDRRVAEPWTPLWPASPHWPADGPHLPLPVLGVPGWWAANEDGNFYRDAAVFRPAPARAGMPTQNPAAAGH